MSRLIYREGIAIPYGDHSRRTIILASDHRGYEMKKSIHSFLREKKMGVIDIGTHTQSRCDYPQISSDLGRMISNDPHHDTIGIGICGSGIGIGIPASKWPGVYVARCNTPKEASTSRKHNNSNVLTLGANTLQHGEAIKIIEAWLSESFDLIEPYLLRYIQTSQLEKKVHRH